MNASPRSPGDGRTSLPVTVVIPVRNGARTIRATLNSLAASETRPAEIIVVDDGSRDNTADTVRHHAHGDPSCRLISLPRSRGAAAARNAGLAEASCPLVLFTDSDVVLESDTLTRLLETLGPDRPRGPAAAVGVYREQNLAGGWFSHFTTCYSAFTYLATGDGEPTNFGSQCVLVRAAELQAAGGFDESLGGATVEDLGMGYRLRAAGGVTRLSARARMQHNSRFGLFSFCRNYAVKSRVFTLIRARTPRRFRRDGGYDSPALPLSIALSGLGWLLLAALPFQPAGVTVLLLAHQASLLLLWRRFVTHAAGIFGTTGALRLFCLKQLALTAVGAGAVSALPELIRKRS